MKSPIRDWFTAAEVAALERVQAQTVRWWIMTGKLEGELAAKNTYLVHESALAEFRERRHAANILPPARGGELSNRPSIRRPIDPGKRYRLPTGEIVTGAEVVRRRGEA